jgi:hypothetical protein
MEQQVKNCPYCGEEILATAKKCKHCGEWLESITDESNEPETVNEEYELAGEEIEVVSTREKVCRYIGWAFYALAVLDLILANLDIMDITGFRYSPVIFAGIGYLISRFGGNVCDEDDE